MRSVDYASPSGCSRNKAYIKDHHQPVIHKGLATMISTSEKYTQKPASELTSPFVVFPAELGSSARITEQDQSSIPAGTESDL